MTKEVVIFHSSQASDSAAITALVDAVYAEHPGGIARSGHRRPPATRRLNDLSAAVEYHYVKALIHAPAAVPARKFA